MSKNRTGGIFFEQDVIDNLWNRSIGNDAAPIRGNATPCPATAGRKPNRKLGNLIWKFHPRKVPKSLCIYAHFF